jgi:hypothetical protein
MDNLNELRTSRLWTDADGILRCEARENVDQTLEDAKAQIALHRRDMAAKPRPILVDIRKARSVSREARAYYAGYASAEIYSAAGFIVESPLSRALGNFFLGLNKPMYPTRLFTSEEEALAWLRQYL